MLECIYLKDEGYLVIINESLHNTLTFKEEKEKTFIQQNDSLKRFKLYRHVSKAIEILRDHGLVHGDIKPQNIISTDDQYSLLKLIDIKSV